MKIKLGFTVVDVTSGFRGTAIQLLEQMNGNVQVAIQPKGDGVAYPEPMFIDHHLIDKVDDGVSKRATPVTEKIEIKLGQEVEDIATGFRGIATEKATYLNGCVNFGVLPKHVEREMFNNNSQASWIPNNRLKVVGDGICKTVKKAPKAGNGKTPGGPAQRVMNRR